MDQLCKPMEHDEEYQGDNRFTMGMTVAQVMDKDFQLPCAKEIIRQNEHIHQVIQWVKASSSNKVPVRHKARPTCHTT